MQKTIILTTTALLFLIATAGTWIPDAIILFFLVGVIPGTAYTVPADIMLIGIAATFWLTLISLPFTRRLIRSIKNKLPKQTKKPKKQLPGRRYSQI